MNEFTRPLADAIRQARAQLLQQLISDCSDSEADALIPIILELLQFMRSNGKTHIEE